MNLKKISIASLAVGAMLSITACGTSEKDQANQSKKEQTNAQEEAKTTSTEQVNASKNEEKEEKPTSKEKSANEKTVTTSANTEQTKNEKNGTKETTSTSAKQNASMKSGVTEVVQLIEEVDKQLKANPKQETVNKLGKQLADKWDAVEKEVEAKHPSDYKAIELNLYPLIVEMEKQKQDIKKLKTLTTNTKQDLNQFLNKL